MNLTDDLLPAAWLWSGHFLYGPLILLALWRAPWTRLLADSTRLNLFLGACVALMVMWSIKAGISPGLNFHYLGATLLTLVFGWPLALVGMGLVLAAVSLNGLGGWQAYSMNALLMGAVPVAVSWVSYRLVDRLLPKNLFVYIFLCGFFGAALAMAATGLMSTAVFAVSETYSLEFLQDHYLPFFLLMVFPEAIITGSFVALLTVYRPEWVATYDEDAWLGK